MRRCPECRSFVPEAVSRCPNCDFQPSAASRSWWLAPLAFLGATAFSGCLYAAYGAPCVNAALGDGGIDQCDQDLCNQALPDGGIKGDDPQFAPQCKPDGG